MKGRIKKKAKEKEKNVDSAWMETPEKIGAFEKEE